MVANRDRVGAGMGPATTSTDPLYDASNDAWLVATIEYEVVGFGTTDLWLQIGLRTTKRITYAFGTNAPNPRGLKRLGIFESSLLAALSRAKVSLLKLFL